MELVPKSKIEIQRLLDGIGQVVILSCKGCLHEFIQDRTAGLEEVKRVLVELGKTIVTIAEMEFLCNHRSTEKFFASFPLASENVILTYSCGIGTQVVASLREEIVVPLANAQGAKFLSGFASVPKKFCEGCGKCVLNQTAGICPVTSCTKGLLNGPCGGARSGKCEIDITRECGWIKIYERLKQQGRLEEMQKGVCLPAYNNVAYRERAEWIEVITQRREKSFSGGLYPQEEKEFTANKAIVDAPVPELLVVPLHQHAGAECIPMVTVGEKVRLGQMIGQSSHLISAPVHSPVSGKVQAIELRPHPVVGNALSVIIENDGLDTPEEDYGQHIHGLEEMPVEQILEVIRAKGIVGMGGAMFPTHVKLQTTKPIEMLIINGCECEPYLTGDHRLMLELPHKVIGGAKWIMRALKTSDYIIAVEDNKKDAAESLLAYQPDARVQVIPTKYPQGAEKILIYTLTGRIVPRASLPLDIGIVVSNVATAVAVYEALTESVPLIRRVVTVSGHGVDLPGNYRVRIGTTLADLLRPLLKRPLHDLISEYTVKMGGPMMGISQKSLDVPVIKGTTGITLIASHFTFSDLNGKCIRCGRCQDVCPIALQPHRLWYYITQENWKKLEELDIQYCIECGCCEYICPARLPLTSIIQTGKKISKEAYPKNRFLDRL